MKSEPDTFGITDLERVGREPWTGVRSKFARNFMRQMAVGDEVLFYHSSCAPPGVAGIARVAATGVIDPTQFDPGSPYHDPKSQQAAPVWDCVEVEYVTTLPRLVTLDELKLEKALRAMMLFKWSRLSVQPVTEAQFRRIIAMAEKPAKPAAKKRARPARRRRAARRPSRDRASRSRP